MLTEPLPASVRAELGQRTAVLTDTESPAHHLWFTADHRALFAGAVDKRRTRTIVTPPERNLNNNDGTWATPTDS